MANEHFFYAVEGDTQERLELKLLDRDLTGATVKFHMRNSAGIVVANVEARVSTTVDANGDAIVSAAVAQQLPPFYLLEALPPGTYEAEFSVTYSSGVIETFPSKGFIEIHIRPEIA